ncbi:TonB family protein [Marinicella sp. S1101]|uniref:TonB family protein n=1 Tax=Marinicella marina TaxID=2996016 RepID=UPI002260CC2C|nr:TonB family protein [Marinicella marina]MCX7552854.1 TonB family protein [Marinicella marina]MDJ1139837.1 TonB family protein [Marinicella marina]
MKSHTQLPVILFSCLLAISTVCWADINQANKAYKQQQFSQAFSSYQDLAQLGNQQAIRRLTHMHINGEGTQKDLIKAYAWSTLIKDTSGKTTLTERITKDLTTEDFSQAQLLAEQFESMYGHAAIENKYTPITLESDKTQNNNDYELNIIQRTPPQITRAQYRKKLQGWSTVSFYIHPDGSTRDIEVISSMPVGEFDQSTIDAVAKFKFDVQFKDGIEPYPIQRIQTITFEMGKTDQSEMTQLFQQHLEELKQTAHAGHPEAQYYYALAASSNSVISNYVPMTDISSNDWLFKAAQNGHLDAQYQLGINIMYGREGCGIDKQKGFNWLVQAADNGHPKSARQAYKLASKQSFENHSDTAPELWLKQAAEAGDPESLLAYANHLLFKEQSQKAINAAKDYLDNYLEQRDKSVKYHQTMAQLYTLENQPKKAKKEMKRANKLAKKLGWEI